MNCVARSARIKIWLDLTHLLLPIYVEKIYRMVEDGQSDEQIVDFMVARYGEFVLYRPRVTGNTWVLWYGPFVLLALGAVVLLLLTRKT